MCCVFCAANVRRRPLMKAETFISNTPTTRFSRFYLLMSYKSYLNTESTTILIHLWLSSCYSHAEHDCGCGLEFLVINHKFNLQAKPLTGSEKKKNHSKPSNLHLRAFSFSNCKRDPGKLSCRESGPSGASLWVRIHTRAYAQPAT